MNAIRDDYDVIRHSIAFVSFDLAFTLCTHVYEYYTIPRWDCLVVSVPACHVVGRGFAFQPGHTKDHHINSTTPPTPLLSM